MKRNGRANCQRFILSLVKERPILEHVVGVGLEQVLTFEVVVLVGLGLVVLAAVEVLE